MGNLLERKHTHMLYQIRMLFHTQDRNNLSVQLVMDYMEMEAELVECMDSLV